MSTRRHISLHAHFSDVFVAEQGGAEAGQQRAVLVGVGGVAGKGVDVAFDTVGPPDLQNCFDCVKPYGDVVTILQPAADTNWSEARKRNIRFSFELMLTPVLLELEDAKQHQGEILRQCAALFDENKLAIELAKTFSLSEASAAQDFLERDHPMGKIVLTI